MIRKLQSGSYRLYSRKLDPKTGRRRNLGTFKTRTAAEKHERAVQYFKRHQVSRFRRSYHLAAPAFTNVGNKRTLASHDPSVALHLTFL